MSKPFIPRPYQPLAQDFLIETPRANLYAGMGLGKTVTVLSLLDALYNVIGESDPTLVLAPLRVATTTWPEEVHKWDHLKDLRVSPVVGTPAQRVAALRRPAQVYVTNYDNLPWLRNHYESMGKPWPFKRVVVDESTRLKSFRTRQGGVRARALADVAHTAIESWINLSGTPSPNGLKDLWGQQWFVDAGARLGRTYAAFENRWFGYRRVQDAVSGDFTIKPVIFPHAQEQIMAKLADCTLAIDPKDWFDLRDPIVTVVEVELPAAARKIYRAMEKEFFAEIQGHDVEAVNAAAKSQKLLQLANGAVYTTPEGSSDRETLEVHDVKLQALESIINESGGMPVLVAYHFKSDLARLQRAFPQGRELDKQPQTIIDWNAGSIPILFAHPESAGHGLNLQDGGNIIVFFAHWWALEAHDQIIERIGPVRQMQAGHDRNVFIYFICARDTIDEVVIARRASKRSVQDTLLDYMKRRAV